MYLRFGLRMKLIKHEVKYLGILTEVLAGFGQQKYMIPAAHSILIGIDFGNKLRVNQHVY